MIKLIVSAALVFTTFAQARELKCSAPCVVGLSVYKVFFDDANFSGYFQRDARKFAWSRNRCVQQTAEVVRCFPSELKNTYVDISGHADSYKTYVSYEGVGAATLFCD